MHCSPSIRSFIYTRTCTAISWEYLMLRSNAACFFLFFAFFWKGVTLLCGLHILGFYFLLNFFNIFSVNFFFCQRFCHFMACNSSLVIAIVFVRFMSISLLFPYPNLAFLCKVKVLLPTFSCTYVLWLICGCVCVCVYGSNVTVLAKSVSMCFFPCILLRYFLFPYFHYFFPLLPYIFAISGNFFCSMHHFLIHTYRHSLLQFVKLKIAFASLTPFLTVRETLRNSMRTWLDSLEATQLCYTYNNCLDLLSRAGWLCGRGLAFFANGTKSPIRWLHFFPRIFTVKAEARNLKLTNERLIFLLPTSTRQRKEDIRFIMAPYFAFGFEEAASWMMKSLA